MTLGHKHALNLLARLDVQHCTLTKSKSSTTLHVEVAPQLVRAHLQTATGIKGYYLPGRHENAHAAPTRRYYRFGRNKQAYDVVTSDRRGTQRNPNATEHRAALYWIEFTKR